MASLSLLVLVLIILIQRTESTICQEIKLYISPLSYDEAAVTEALIRADIHLFSSEFKRLNDRVQDFVEAEYRAREQLSLIRALVNQSPCTLSLREDNDCVVITHQPDLIPIRNFKIQGIELMGSLSWYRDPISIDLIEEAWAAVYQHGLSSSRWKSLEVELHRYDEFIPENQFSYVNPILQKWADHFLPQRTNFVPLTELINSVLVYGNETYPVLKHFIEEYRANRRFAVTMLEMIDTKIKMIKKKAELQTGLLDGSLNLDELERQFENKDLPLLFLDELSSYYFSKVYAFVMNSETERNWVKQPNSKLEYYPRGEYNQLFSDPEERYIHWALCHVQFILQNGLRSWIERQIKLNLED